MSEMSPAKKLFFEALEKTNALDRAAFLDAACAGDDALRARVDRLLSAHDFAERLAEADATSAIQTDMLSTQQMTGAHVADEPPPSDLVTGEHQPNVNACTLVVVPPTQSPAAFVPGQVIAGRYMLVGVLGEGGMGRVFRAEQSQPVKRQVALKLIKVGMDSRVVVARFDAERQALAMMDHPNIARVFDGGTTEANQPFFVMELVNGVPITDYCDQHRMPVRARLVLFASVCQAVQHAHQKGIIHRDLKPGNVLVAEVDGRPTPKVIDFGVAKAIEFKLTDKTFGDTGAIVGTPTYMSPEQADPTSMDIDTRTDVYALGVLLYELLAGSPPIDAEHFRRAGLLEMLRMVREDDPPRPSTKLSTSDALPNIAASRDIDPEQLKRALRGDLDWIVMKALEKDRTRRYDTANGFAADIQRHLAYEPVLAAPPSRTYRLQKFVRKNRGAVISASLVLLALLAGIAGTTWGLIRADLALIAEARRVTERDDALKKEAERVKERDAAIQVADARADELKYRLGVSDMVLAVAAHNNRNGQLAAERLASVPREQRGWEWHYLKRQAHGLFTLYGHTGGISSVSFSPDGSRILTGSEDQKARVWDARTGTLLLELKGHTSWVMSVAYSPDGLRIFTGAEDGTARVWDARTGTRLLDLKGHQSRVSSVSFSPDGSRILTGSSDRTARVWDARTGATLLELKPHSSVVMSVSFSPDGLRFLTGSYDGTVRVWDARAGTLRMELKGNDLGLKSVSFSPDGLRFLTGSQDGTARVRDARTGTSLLELKGHNRQVSSASFSPDGSRILTGGDDGTAQVWDARTGTLLLEIKGHTGGVSSVSFSPDGSHILTGSHDRTARVWDARTGTPLLELKGHTFGVLSVSFSPDGSRFLTGGADGTARVVETRTGTPLLELRGHTAGVKSMLFSPDGSRILTGSYDRTARVWDARTGTPFLELKGHTGDLTSVSFSPDGSRFLTGSRDGTARVWDARTGTPLLELKGHIGYVMCVSFSPDGSRILTGGLDRTARVWDSRTGTLILELKGHTGGVMCVSFSPDGSRILTGSYDRTARVWDARTGTPFLELKGHTGDLTSVSFSPDGSRFLTGSRDGTARVWDARTSTPLLELRGHTGEVLSASFSPDGSRFLTGSNDGTARVWDARIGIPFLELKGHTGEVTSATFSPDGSRFLTGSYDHTARVWDARTGTPLLELKGHQSQVLSVSFSPDGTRFLTGGEDGTARVWDARTGTPLLELRGHTGGVICVSFSPDGSRILTGGGDGTARVWDARIGLPLLELKGHTFYVANASFNPDGSRIVTQGFNEGTKVWDARTGEELKGLLIPPEPDSGRLSPDGRLFAHFTGNLVEVVLLQPDPEELEYRRFQSRPNLSRYREGYNDAMRANDVFAARFYLNLLPPAERTRALAEPILIPLFDRLGLRDYVVAALQSQPAVDPEAQAACLELAAAWPETAEVCNNISWTLVRDPGKLDATYRRGLRLARAACQLNPENISYLNTLGIAQYRCGLMAEAVVTLTYSNHRNNGKEMSDLAFLALAQHHLDQTEGARITLGKIRELMKAPRLAANPEARGFLREAAVIELDQAFPANPFAP